MTTYRINKHYKILLFLFLPTVSATTQPNQGNTNQKNSMHLSPQNSSTLGQQTVLDKDCYMNKSSMLSNFPLETSSSTTNVHKIANTNHLKITVQQQEHPSVNSRQNYGELGKVCFREKRYKEAIICYNKGLEMQIQIGHDEPCIDKARLLHNLACCHYELEEWEQAIDYHRQTVIVLDLLNETNDEVLTIYALAHNNLGHYNYKKKKFKDAIICYNKSLEVQIQIGHDEPRIDKARLLHNLACCHYELEESEQAIDYHRQTVIVLDLLNETNDEVLTIYALAHNNLGHYNYKKKKFKDAIICYNKGLEVQIQIGHDEPRIDKARVLHNLACCHYELEDWEQATDYYRQTVIVLDLLNETNDEVLTIYALAHNNLGHCNYKKKKFKDAIICYNKGLEVQIQIGHDEPRIDKAQLLYNLACCHYELEEWEQATDYYRQTVIVLDLLNETDDEVLTIYALAHNNLGHCNYKKKKFKDAIICYNKGLEVQKQIGHDEPRIDKAQLLYNLACCHYELEEWEQAIIHCRLALKIWGRVRNNNARDNCIQILNMLKDIYCNKLDKDPLMESYYEEAILGLKFSDQPYYFYIAPLFYKSGTHFCQKGEIARAIDYHKQAKYYYKELPTMLERPQDKQQAYINYAITLYKLGNIYYRLKCAQTIDCYKESLTVLVSNQPNHPLIQQLKKDLAIAKKRNPNSRRL